jgi:septal ring factor EnvC (AmiA/AmiB activator)
MRKMIITAAAAVSALAIAAPAAAQWAPAPPPQAYGYGYGQQGYGYNHNYGQVRALQVRLNQIERQIDRLDRRNRLSDREADRLRRDANRIERQLRAAAHNGLNPYEHRQISIRIARLEQNVRYQANDGNRWGRNEWRDRDRDGRPDRWEDDRGWDHD